MGSGQLTLPVCSAAKLSGAFGQTCSGKWAEIREAQRKTLALSGTGMAVTIDIGEWNDVHPVNKKDVGYRLALAAWKIAYKD